jgi:uncharacterized membrane protein YeaQ/YmgE (transglycosylase-associated protein family)
MSILAWLVVGLIAGWLASLVMGSSRYGIVGDIILGIIGAIVGGFLAGALFGIDPVSGINIETILVAFIGAVVVIAIFRAVTGRSPV